MRDLYVSSVAINRRPHSVRVHIFHTFQQSSSDFDSYVDLDSDPDHTIFIFCTIYCNLCVAMYLVQLLYWC